LLENLFFKSPNVPGFTATKKFQKQQNQPQTNKNQNNLIHSQNNFFNRLRKNHSISNIASPINNNSIQPNHLKNFEKIKEKFVPFRRSSINSAMANKSLNISAKSKQSKSNTKHSIYEEKNVESSVENTRIMQMINDCNINSKDLSAVLGELTHHEKTSFGIINTLVEKIESCFEMKKEELNKMEIRIREKDEKVKKLEKEKKEIVAKKQEQKIENNQNPNMMKENLLLKEKIMEQQGKIMEMKSQEKKFLQFLKELQHKGIDLEKLYEDKQNKKKKKELERKKIVEELLTPQLVDLDNFSYQADESIVNESRESSFNYYGKPVFDDSYMKIKDKKEKEKFVNSEIKPKKNFKINLNLKAIKSPQAEKKNMSNSNSN